MGAGTTCGDVTQAGATCGATGDCTTLADATGGDSEEDR
jgi:hypothetical protein